MRGCVGGDALGLGNEGGAGACLLYTSRDIAALFVAEALVLTVAAALCGMALAEGMLRGVGAVSYTHLARWLCSHQRGRS